MCILNKMKTESFECRKGVLRVSGTLIMTVPNSIIEPIARPVTVYVSITADEFNLVVIIERK